MERTIELFQDLTSRVTEVVTGLSSEFWSGILGAVLGAVVGGCISYVLQRQAARETRNQRSEDHMRVQRGLANSLLVKVVRIHSGFYHIHRHIESCFDNAAKTGHGGEPWQFVLPLANFAEPVHLSSDEMGMLLGLKDNDVFGKIVELDAIHNSLIDATRLMSAERRALSERLTPDKAQENIFTGNFDEQQYMALRPQMVDVNSLIEQIRAESMRDVEESFIALKQLNELLGKRLGLTYRIESKAAMSSPGA